MKFAKSLLTNRFGIILAAINIAYFLYQSNNLAVWLNTFPSRVFMCMNLPAAILALVLNESFRFCIPGLSFYTYFQIELFLFSFSIILQWLLIAHLAGAIARRLQSN